MASLLAGDVPDRLRCKRRRPMRDLVWGPSGWRLTTWLTGISWWHFGYQPRHRSTRRAAAEAERLTTDAWDEPLLTQSDQAPQPDESGPASRGEPDLHDHLSADQLRHLLEGCARDAP